MTHLHKNMRISVLTVVAVVTTLGNACAQRPTKQEVTEQILYMSLSKGHYSPIDSRDTLSARTFKVFLERLDYGKSFLLQSDVAQMREYLPSLSRDVEEGRSPMVQVANDAMKKRTAQVLAYVREIMAAPFEYTSDETLQSNPDKREFPRSEAELKELWRKVLKLQTLQRYLSLMDERDNPDSATKAAAAKGERKPVKSDAALEAEAREKILKQTTDRITRLQKETDYDRHARFLEAIAASYDSHTEYFPPKEKEDFDIQMSGTLEGIGATLREQEGYIKVESLVPGGPAWKGKELQAEDVILKVAQGDGEPVDITDMRLDDAVRLIRGRKGSVARLTVKKPDGRIVGISITRDLVQIEEGFAKSVIISDAHGAGVGYINLPKFYADFNRANGKKCAEDVRKELEKLRAEKVRGIILDLRNNGGGSLQDAVRMSGLFIPEGPIVQVSENQSYPEILHDRDPAVQYDGPLVVLVNTFSASASEILSAALQDYGRAVIVGSKTTFGKGTVQTFIDLNGYLSPEYASFGKLGALKITFQKFYRVNGRSTQFNGVTPDIILPDVYDEIPVGERQTDYPLGYDTIPAVQFTVWNGLREILPTLRANSATRTGSNPVFAAIRKQSGRLKVQRDATEEYLNLNKAKAEQEQLRAEGKELENSRQENTALTVRAPKADAAPLDKSQQEKAADWHKQIRKDAVIGEALAIIGDMLTLAPNTAKQ